MTNLAGRTLSHYRLEAKIGAGGTSGVPITIAHLHEGNTFTHPHGMSVSADKIVLLMNQGSANIWMTHVGR